MYMYGNRFKYLGYIFFLFSYSIPSTPMLGAGLDRPCIEIKPHVFPCRAALAGSGRSREARVVPGSRCPSRVHGRRMDGEELAAGGSEPRAPACVWLLLTCSRARREAGRAKCGVWRRFRQGSQVDHQGQPMPSRVPPTPRKRGTDSGTRLVSAALCT